MPTDEEKIGGATQSALVRDQRPERLRASFARTADGVRARGFYEQAGGGHHQHVERSRAMPLPLPRARAGYQARYLAGGRLSGRAPGDVAFRAVREAVKHDVPQLSRHGDGGVAAPAPD